MNQHIKLEVLEKVVTNSKGEGHYKVNSFKYKADYGSDLKLNLTNLFRNNPVISKYLYPTVIMYRVRSFLGLPTMLLEYRDRRYCMALDWT